MWTEDNTPRVVDNGDGTYETYDSRRVAAARMSGQKEIPVRVVDPHGEFEYGPQDTKPKRPATWKEKFRQRHNDKRALARGGPVPEGGLRELPAIEP